MPASPNWQAIEDLICQDLARCIRITQEYRPNESIRAAIYCNFYVDEQSSASPTCLWQPHPYPVKHGFARLKTASVKCLRATETLRKLPSA